MEQSISKPATSSPNDENSSQSIFARPVGKYGGNFDVSSMKFLM